MVIDSFAVSRRDCICQATGPIPRGRIWMLSLTIGQGGSLPLRDQIVAGIKCQIDDRHLRPGTKLPSIRKFAATYHVSRFTVVEAYDRLVAMGYLQSRRGAGFFTSASPLNPGSA